MTPELKNAIAHCRDSIIKGSKSFSLAARLFDSETRDAAFCLYGWCRRCDDEIDTVSHLNKMDRLNELKKLTTSCYDGHPQNDPVFRAFQFLIDRYHIPKTYPLELLEGMAMDVRGDRYETMGELKLYCYRVAGTVGLMMSHIMGLSHERALQNACDLGIAMQLTNIARDVREDYEMNRVYVPLAWMKEVGLPVREMLSPAYRSKLVFLVKQLLEEADRYYLSGEAGLRYLSIRTALAISSARQIYSEIGNGVLKRGPQAWEGRAVVSTPRKVIVMGRGLWPVLTALPHRMVFPWKAVPINKLWNASNYIEE